MHTYASIDQSRIEHLPIWTPILIPHTLEFDMRIEQGNWGRNLEKN